MLPLEVQGYMFLVMVLAGACSGLICDFYRAFRGFTRPKGFLAVLEDLSFWFIVTVLTVVAMVYANWVDIRLYVPVGVVAGFALYWFLASPAVYPLFQGLFIIIRKSFKLAVKTAAAAAGGVVLVVTWVLRPLVLVGRIVSFPARWLWKRVRKADDDKVEEE